VATLRESLIELLRFIQTTPYDFDKSRDGGSLKEPLSPFQARYAQLIALQHEVDSSLQQLINQHSAQADLWFSRMRFAFTYQTIEQCAKQRGLKWRQMSTVEQEEFQEKIFDPLKRTAKPVGEPKPHTVKVQPGQMNQPKASWLAYTQGTGIPYPDPYLVLLFQRMEDNTVQRDAPVQIENPEMVMAIGFGADLFNESERRSRRNLGADLVMNSQSKVELKVSQTKRNFRGAAPYEAKFSPIDTKFLNVLIDGFKWDLNTLKTSSDDEVEGDFLYLLNEYEQCNLKERMMTPESTTTGLNTADASAPLSQSLAENAVELIRHGYRNIMLSGPPGTSKSFVVNEIAKLLLSEIFDESDSSNPGPNVVNLQFHPAYSYEDFVEGWRPTRRTSSSRLGESNGPDFEIVSGKLLKAILEPDQILRQSQWWEKNKTLAGIKWSADIKGGADILPPVFVVLDEVNRANIPRVFGEVLQLIEVSKRSNVPLPMQGGDEVEFLKYCTTSIRLAASGELLAIPENFIFISTMNTSDRSIARIDDAFRRRFTFIDCQPDPNRLSEIWLKIYGDRGVPQGAISADEIREGFTKLNEYLDNDLATYKDKKIGHTYFIPTDEEQHEGFNQEFLNRRWKYQVLPYLQSIKDSLPGEIEKFGRLENWRH